MKTMTKLFLMVALLGSTAMADGEMGNGAQGCTVNCPPPPPPCTVDCGNGLAAPGDSEINSVDVISEDVILVFVKEYLDLLF